MGDRVISGQINFKQNIDSEMQSAAGATDIVIRKFQEVDAQTKEYILTLAREGESLEGIIEFLASFGYSANAAKQAVEELGISVEDSTNAVEESSSAYSNNFTMLREGRLVMGAMIADMALMQLTAGQTNPQLQEMAKSIQMVISAGLMGMMLDPVVGLVAALGAGVLALGQMASQASPQIEALNKQLDSLTKKDDAVQGLAQLAGVTDQQAQAALDAAKKNSDYAQELDNLTKKAESGYNVFDELGKALNEIGQLAGEVGDRINQLASSFGVNLQAALVAAATNQNYNSVLQQMQQEAAAARDAQNALNEAVSNVPPPVQSATEAMKAANKELDNLVNEGVAAADKGMGTNKMQTAYATLTKELETLAHERTAKAQDELNSEAAANQAMDDTILKARQSLNDALARDAQALADNIANIQHTLADKEASIAHTLAEQQIEYAQKVSRAQIEELQKEADIDFNTSIQVANAKTEREAEQIEFKANYDKSKQQEQLQNSLATDAQQMQSEQDKANYDMQLAQQAADYSIQQARRKYSEQEAAAEQSFNQQVADAQRRDQQQIASLRQRLVMENAALDQAAAQDQERYQQAIANDNQLTQIKIDNLQKWLDAQTTAYQAAFAMERALDSYFSGNHETPMPNTFVRVTGGGDTPSSPSLGQAASVAGGVVQLNLTAFDPQSIADAVRSYLELSSWQGS